MRTFHCDKCGQQVFFENVRCENCGGLLGYEPERRAIFTFEPDGEHRWRSLHPADAGRLYKKCVNYEQQNVCNWMLPADSPDALCASCRLTRVIPNLSNEKNHLYWQRLETAKRRLLYTLWDLRLQPPPKQGEDDGGLAFEFLESTEHGHVTTGHANGVITINVAEADPAHRERTREQMHEPYRTLLGHFRHESGHYYWDRLIANSAYLEPFRTLFGDEQEDYAEALQRHYRDGPSANWAERYISAYATMHPWEDWAETWAHYLHMIDTLDTAHATGMQLQPQHPGEPALALETHPVGEADFTELMNAWFALTYALNSLNRSVGMPDAYPFMLSTPVIDKLRFVHDVVHAPRLSKA
ncbi:hypothetical protein E4K72_22770 [Oxalobacteraceae bacterium OM1]|nr:hypothetical protein E4K72_22770 [Oxalobacteraceae bacterium OM1]